MSAPIGLPLFRKEFETFRLKRGKSTIEWHGPDDIYSLNPDDAPEGEWYMPVTAKDSAKIPKMAFIKNPGNKYFGSKTDSVLILSLEGACSRAATLLHDGDDEADREYYFATDSGNQTHDKIKEWPVDQWAFILRSPSNVDSPVKHMSDFHVVCFRVSPASSKSQQTIKLPNIFGPFLLSIEFWLEIQEKIMQSDAGWLKELKRNYNFPPFIVPQSDAIMSVGELSRIKSINEIEQSLSDSNNTFLIKPSNLSHESNKLLNEILKNELNVR